MRALDRRWPRPFPVGPDLAAIFYICPPVHRIALIAAATSNKGKPRWLKRAVVTREALELQRKEIERDLVWVKSSVKAAVSKVVESEGATTELMVEYRAAQAEVARFHEVLSELSSWNCVPDRWDNVVHIAPSNAERPWAEALSALEKDANASLPD